MADTFTAMKKNRDSALSRLTKEAEKLAKGKFEKQEDDRFWYPAVDKSGNGYAVIRFLPAPQGEDVPWVRIWNHGFKGPTGQWYIENCLSTLGQKDPVLEYNAELWKQSDSDDSWQRKQVRQQKRKLTYIANVLVIKDSLNPENEGKVFLFKFGAKIFEKLNAKMNPAFEDDAAINPFDLWEGCNFRVKIRTVKGADGKGYRNYDDSTFDAPSALAPSDSEIERVWKSEYSLQQFVAPDQFKSYDVLQKRLNLVLGVGGANKPASTKELEDEVDNFVEGVKTAEADVGKKADDDELDYFRNLAEDDE